MRQHFNTGFALSGGFIKGFAHLGVMQALLEHDIKPDIISGVSAGALVGAFYADGNEPYRILDYFAGQRFQDLTKMIVPKAGFFDLGEFIDFLRTNIKARRIEELKLPFIATATDLDRGCSVHFRSGEIAERVAASCCMPVMFRPIKIGVTHYVDGGILMNMPVETIRKDCDRVVGINVSPMENEKYKMNILGIATRSYHLMFRANAISACELCDLLIEPCNLRGYSNRELEKAEEIFDHGYHTALSVLNNISKDKFHNEETKKQFIS